MIMKYYDDESFIISWQQRTEVFIHNFSSPSIHVFSFLLSFCFSAPLFIFHITYGCRDKLYIVINVNIEL